ncbi:MAG: outer membrane lipoprotein-sorting protein [Verrucomicrobia bacterium]|nr:outer membrane lipoprotein-sorting protein [Verrucomicrobiota bacterium]
MSHREVLHGPPGNRAERNRKEFNMKYAAVLIIALGFATGVATAQEKLTGRQIAEKVYARNDGTDSVARVEMTLFDKSGAERKRQLDMKSKDRGDLSDSFIEFTAPADIAGTRFLTLDNKTEDDIQYLFLPAVGRARRIVGGQKDQSFVNTDFTYEDMTRRSPEEDNQTLLKEEKWEGFDCYVVEMTSIKPDDSQYSKTITWIDKQSFVAVRVDFYDKKGEKTKQLTVKKLEQKSGIWTVMEAVMENFKRKTKTVLKTTEMKYNSGLEDKIFTLRNLEEK